ncbi:hypothetical protein Nepgr_008318 [Nepenthes gracilis]|uniref:Uncharacterized protein n=1 Tax=Nepenthes gracilis TaxID=150966 RepID=A0AAD3XJ53_NEPGR|nr:hypothetical protein Nepgr_008318 [Nepenthes gracilis]
MQKDAGGCIQRPKSAEEKIPSTEQEKKKQDDKEENNKGAVGGGMTTRIAPGVGANLLGQHSAGRNQEATAYVGNLDRQAIKVLNMIKLYGKPIHDVDEKLVYDTFSGFGR